MHIEASLVVHARPETIYAVLADYHVGHAAIIPRPPFTGLEVESGGHGAGTMIRAHMKVFGTEFHYHQQVTEPEPGRVLMETDVDTGQYTQFIIKPVDGGAHAIVTIASEFPTASGIKGFLERLTQPPVVRRIYLKELHILDEYVRQLSVSAN